MESIRIRNLRSLRDTGEVFLKEINLFVGHNSSGKSSFLRTFPLIRQSIERDTRGPILWNDESLVDFGSFEEAKNRYVDQAEGIKLGFKLKISNEPSLYYWDNHLNIGEDTIISIEIEILVKNKKNFIGTIRLSFEDQQIDIEANHDGQIKTFKINEADMLFTEGAHELIKISNTGIIPMLIIFDKKKDGAINPEYYSLKCVDIMKKIIGRRLRNVKRINKIIETAVIGSKEAMLESLKEQDSIKSWGNKVNMWNINSPLFLKINDLIIAHKTASILLSIDHVLKTYFKECNYIAPVRAKANRYYRYQDLSVYEIDAYGDNMHMFLNNLNVGQKTSYQNFVKKAFGFTPSTKSKSGHITIEIKDNKGDDFNLVDLGFGYSQILPIITKLWYAISERKVRVKPWEKKKKMFTVLIEQPELHLHPAMQAQLADVFMNVIQKAKENEVDLKLIIETHSPVIINRIGRRIIEKKFNSEQVNVVLFELDNELKNTIVKTTEFNERGVLNNWPLGFFEPNN